MIPMGSGPIGIIFQKQYHWGLTPLVLFCSLYYESKGFEILVK